LRQLTLNAELSINICDHTFFVRGPKFTTSPLATCTRHGRLKNFSEDIPNNQPEVIEAHMLIAKF